MVINHNIPALTTYGIVNNTSNSLEKSIQKLSTGLRINSAADDAAGLSISEKMRAQIGGLDRAVANAQDGVSLIQTAEGALTETHSILQRMRELSVQAANDTLTQQDRSYIQEEVDLLRDEIDHIGNTTTFNTKKLLNGDAAVLWSSDNLTTKALVRGGLREVDQFGQKKSFEGNYKITIEADPGQSEIQKTDIFKVKHPKVGGNYELNAAAKGIVENINSDGLRDGVEYTLASNNTKDANAATVLTGSKNTGTALTLSALQATGAGTWEVGVEVKSVNLSGTGANDPGSITFAVKGYHTSLDGKITEVNQTIALSGADRASITAGTEIKDSAEVGSGLKLTDTLSIGGYKEGDKFILRSNTASTNGQLTVTSNDATPVAHTFALNDAGFKGGDKPEFGFVSFDSDGNLAYEKVSLKIDDQFTASTSGKDLTTDASTSIGKVKNFEIGDVAKSTVKLRDLDKFWDSQGNFMLDDPQTITINQGNGKTASVTLYGHDTLKDVEDKLNDAIANQLGQADYIDTKNLTADEQKEAKKHFVDFVDKAQSSGSESVEGTFLIRTIVPGSDGTIRFASKSEDLLNAFSLNTIQDAKETTYTVSITDAHTGESVVSAEKITGNKLIGKLHENIDVEFDAMSGVTAKWVDGTKEFTYNTAKTETILHLADNTLTFQIGANEGDDMGINIGDMRSHALGLDSVLVTDRDSASRSITVIDNAIDKVSTQRAKLGAYQNRLEHTMTNLETSSENLSSAESRIRDTDMAKEMMNFTKLNIMLQAGNSMLAQANQLPQNVLSLIR
ncbi:MAG: flagellin [Synergistaceae bacterium]|nr:flagellin [Synergistaceae bacterium]